MLYLLVAGKKALEDGGVTEDVMKELDKLKCGILIGSAIGGMKVMCSSRVIKIPAWSLMPFRILVCSL